MILKGRKIYTGQAAGEALVTRMGISFFGGVDPESGVVVERGHELEGRSIGGRVLVFPTGKGSTVGSYTLPPENKRACASSDRQRPLRDVHRRRLYHRRDPVR